MCDTIVALGNTTADGTVLLAKNSDREPNEGQSLVYFPRAAHAPGKLVRCTYVEVPQVAETYAVLLSKPFWIWGGEMGVNEHGVAIGNEAVFCQEPCPKTGLLGMDLLRLALERAATTQAALEVIVELLERHGQGGPGNPGGSLFYHNSYLIADPREAWVLETVARQWAARRVEDLYAISNGLTIGREWDRASAGLVDHAVERGWCRSADDFDLARCYSDRLYTPLNRCAVRQRRTTELLRAQAGRIDAATMMAILRDHGPAGQDPTWSPAGGSMRQVCMHAGFGPTRPSQTTASIVFHLDPQLLTCWATATAAPCTAIFKPLYPEAGLPDMGPQPTGVHDPDSLWWQHERLHRSLLPDYAARLALYSQERDDLEAAFLDEAGRIAAAHRQAAPEERQAALADFSASCFERARERTAAWTERVRAAPPGKRPAPLFRLAWRRYNRQACWPEPVR